MTADASRDEGWDDRRLCSDESCIGVIGPDGRCKECGKPGGDPAPRPAVAPGAGPQLAPAGSAPEPAPTAAAPDDWDDRRLCSDESCIGVIGPDGRCKECGKPFSG
jgi:hypothetical protein